MIYEILGVVMAKYGKAKKEKKLEIIRAMDKIINNTKDWEGNHNIRKPNASVNSSFRSLCYEIVMFHQTSEKKIVHLMCIFICIYIYMFDNCGDNFHGQLQRTKLKRKVLYHF